MTDLPPLPMVPQIGATSFPLQQLDGVVQVVQYVVRDKIVSAIITAPNPSVLGDAGRRYNACITMIGGSTVSVWAPDYEAMRAFCNTLGLGDLAGAMQPPQRTRTP